MKMSVVETAEFVRRARALVSDAERMVLIDALASNPGLGVSLGGGLYKMRFARPGAGKRDGYRIIYYYAARPDEPLFLLTIFAKNDKANLTDAEQAAVADYAATLAKGYRRRQ